MDQFKCVITTSLTENVWTCSGPLNELAVLPVIDKSKPLSINMKKVTLVNSYGIRIWCKWIQENKDFKDLILEECPYIFVNNFNIINGFITNLITINSFYVPFFSEDSQERKDVLFHLGADYQFNGFLRIPDVKDSKGEYMEMDVNPIKYFSFLKRR